MSRVTGAPIPTDRPTSAALMDQDQAQRRTLGTLMATQVLGGVGLAAGATVGSLLAEEISGRTMLAGLGGTFQTLGSAVLAIPIAALAHRSGRRPSLAAAYGLAAVGAAVIVIAAAWSSFLLFLVGSVLLGSATAGNSAARYAATDLARPERRGRDLSLVVWVTTLGSVFGPNLAGPAAPLARALGLDVLTGPFVVSVVVLACAGVVIALRLVPDPMLLSRELAGIEPGPRKGTLRRGAAAVRASRGALGGVAVMSLGHLVMIAVMVMTPLHLTHGDASLEVVGLVISGHILGMFAFAPVMGMAVDRLGAAPVAVAGGLIQVAATVLAAFAAEGFSVGLSAGLFLLGLGWSATLVSGSAILVGAVPLAERAGTQGLGDLVMGLSAAAGGVVAGIVVEQASFAWLGRLGTVGALAIVVIGAALVRGLPSGESRA